MPMSTLRFRSSAGFALLLLPLGFTLILFAFSSTSVSLDGPLRLPSFTISSPFRAASFSSSTLFNSDTCPNPLAPRPDAARYAVDLSSPTCYAVESTYNASDPDALPHPFTVTVCPHATRCNAFSIHIIHDGSSSCMAYPNRTLSVDEAMNAALAAKGPDVFYLHSDGESERWASQDPVYLGDCSYRFDGALQNAGRTELRLEWLHRVSPRSSFRSAAVS